MKIICFGDSNTWGYDPRGYFGGRYDAPWPEIIAGKLGCTVNNQGENGREIPKQSVHFPADTDLLIVMLGTNDLLQGSSPEGACEKMEPFLKSLNLDRERILLIAPPPMKMGLWVPHQQLIDDSRSLAKQYQILAKRMGVRFADAGQWKIPLTFDGVHFTADGHRAFAEFLYRKLHDARK